MSPFFCYAILLFRNSIQLRLFLIFSNVLEVSYNARFFFGYLSIYKFNILIILFDFVFVMCGLQIRDTLPFIMAIIQPNLRPVNTHLYSQREKDELHNLVNLLVCFNLNYVQEKTLEGAYIYR